jgi:hypothetical protein
VSVAQRFIVEVEYERDPDDQRSERYEEDTLYGAGIRHEDVGGEGDLAENIAALGEGKQLQSVDEATGRVVTARRLDSTTVVEVGAWISIAGRQLEVERLSSECSAFLRDTRDDRTHLTAEQLASFGYRVKS